MIDSELFALPIGVLIGERLSIKECVCRVNEPMVIGSQNNDVRTNV